MATRPIRIMIVGTHPADGFDQAGGTLAHHAANGDQITAVIVTTGSRSHHWKLLDEKKRLQEALDVEERVAEAEREKTEEVKRACRILGFDDVRSLGFEDDEMPPTREMCEAIADAIRDIRPDLLIMHHPYEGGGFKMHATVGQATLHAWYQAMGTGRGAKRTHMVPAIYIMAPTGYHEYCSLGYASTSHVDVCVDITDVVEKKVRAIDEISTQYYGGAYARKTVETDDGHHGQGVAYAEAFQRFQPQLCYTLPISDAEIHIAQEPHLEKMGRRGEIIASLLPLPDGQSFASSFRIPKEMHDV